MAKPKPKRCKDCVREGITTDRVLATKKDGVTLEPGPRCVTHHRARKKVLRKTAHARRTEANFQLKDDDYWALYEFQGGRCFICHKARGFSRHLAVDHEHNLCEDHPPEKGCPRCIRALLCGRCNELIGWLDPPALLRAIIVMQEAPARKFLADRAQRKAQVEDVDV